MSEDMNIIEFGDINGIPAVFTENYIFLNAQPVKVSIGDNVYDINSTICFESPKLEIPIDFNKEDFYKILEECKNRTKDDNLNE